MNTNKRFWSNTAKFYNKFTRGNTSANEAYFRIEDLIISQLDENMCVLELASGPGTISSKITQACKYLTITDFSEEMVTEAKKNVVAQNVCFEIADAINLKYNDDSFDAVIIANALHIMPHPQKALEEIKRVLTEKGVLICPTFTRETAKEKLIEVFLELIGFRTYSRWTHLSFITFIKENNLKIIQEEIIYGYSFPISYVVCTKN